MSVLEINRRPSARDLRWFGFILPAFFAIVGTVARLRFGAETTGTVLWVLGGALTALYAAIPPLRIAVYLGWMNLFFPLGWVVSHLAIAVLFYGVVTPMALLMRILRHDPMQRRREKDAPTYWREHRTARDPSRYLRQY